MEPLGDRRRQPNRRPDLSQQQRVVDDAVRGQGTRGEAGELLFDAAHTAALRNADACVGAGRHLDNLRRQRQPWLAEARLDPAAAGKPT
jgi:hypothetical protein